jgi:phosphate transport system protein
MKHTDREYEAELQHLRERLLLMGARIEEMIVRAMRAFSESNVELAREIIALDEQVDRLEMSIDEQCVKILAKRQPVASDLRFLTTTLKIVTDLERVGDLAVNICERVVELEHQPALAGRSALESMGSAAHGMMHDALDAFIQRNVDLAQAVIERDSSVDAAYAQTFPALMALMIKSSDNVYPAQRLQSIGKYLERIADHATNVAEMVVFMVRGEDPRHSHGVVTH